MKDDRITFRIKSEEKGRWFLYAHIVGYDDLSKFIRDCINGIIDANQKPSKVFIIENKTEL